jgi:hypothetical protein
MGLAHVVVVSLTSPAVGSGEQSRWYETKSGDHTSGSSTYSMKEFEDSFKKESVARSKLQ